MPCYVTGGVFPVAQALRMPLPKCSYLTQVPPNGLAGGRKNVKTRAEAAGGHPGREDERYGAPSRSPSASPQKLRDRPWGRQLLRSERGLSFYIFNTKPCFLNSNKVLEQTTKEESATVSEKANKDPQRAGGARVNQALSEPYLLRPAATSALPASSSAAAAVGGSPARPRAQPHPDQHVHARILLGETSRGAGRRPLYKRELGGEVRPLCQRGGRRWERVAGGRAG